MARAVMALVVVALAVIVETAGGAQQAPATAPVPPTTPTPPSTMLPPNLPCVAQLMPCADSYQNASAKPAEACCAPLKKAYAGELDCLCAVLTNPALGGAIGVDRKKGMSLFEHCGVKVPADVCSSHAAAPGPASSPQTSPPKAGSGASHGAKCLGYPGFLGFLLAVWSLLA